MLLVSRWIACFALLACLAPDGSALADEGGPDYAPYGQGVFLPFVNAPESAEEPARVPKLLVSFGEEPRPIVMDTGSTGIVISADRIPNVDGLPARPGQLTYSSSGRIMIGRWVTTPLTIFGRDGQSVAVQPLPVLAVDRIACTDHARDCRPEDNPRGVAMMGVGFGREYDSQSESTPDKNPLLNLAPMGRDPARRGYIVTRTGVHVGLTRANTRGAFRFAKLDPQPGIAGEWTGVPVCITVNGQEPAACGHALVDTGVTSMFLTLPAAQVAGATTSSNGPPVLSDGTRLGFSFPGTSGAPVAATYNMAVGDDASLMAPERVHLNTTRPEVFVNTSVRFLDGFDVLYDADGGYLAFRAHDRMRANTN